MLARMASHARLTLEDLGTEASRLKPAAARDGASSRAPNDARDGAAADGAVMHAGARAVLAVLQPPLLLAFLQPESACAPKVGLPSDGLLMPSDAPSESFRYPFDALSDALRTPLRPGTGGGPLPAPHSEPLPSLIHS